jgi:hypothetical protein
VLPVGLIVATTALTVWGWSGFFLFLPEENLAPTRGFLVFSAALFAVLAVLLHLTLTRARRMSNGTLRRVAAAVIVAALLASVPIVATGRLQDLAQSGFDFDAVEITARAVTVGDWLDAGSAQVDEVAGGVGVGQQSAHRRGDCGRRSARRARYRGVLRGPGAGSARLQLSPDRDPGRRRRPRSAH